MATKYVDPMGVVHDRDAIHQSALYVTACERGYGYLEVVWADSDLRKVPEGTTTTCLRCICVGT